MFSCVAWWVLLGSLLGTLFSWMLGNLVHSQKGDEVELNEKNSLIQSQSLEISKLNSEILGFKSLQPKIIEKIIEKPTIDPRIVNEKNELLSQVSKLRLEITELQSIQPKVVEKVIEKKVVDNKLVDEKNELIKDLQARLNDLMNKFEKARNVLEERNEKIKFLQPPEMDIQVAKNKGLKIRSQDDLEVIEGIGPVIAILLKQKGINTFLELSRTSVAKLEAILNEAGPNFKFANPSTWPEQASLAANSSWNALSVYQKELIGGKVRIGNA